MQVNISDDSSCIKYKMLHWFIFSPLFHLYEIVHLKNIMWQRHEKVEKSKGEKNGSEWGSWSNFKQIRCLLKEDKSS